MFRGVGNLEVAKADMERPQKRDQVKVACVNCQKACKKCDQGRPCQRCVRYGLMETCSDSVRKERMRGLKRGPYKRRELSGSSGGISESTDDSVTAVHSSVSMQRDSELPATRVTINSKQKPKTIQKTTPPSSSPDVLAFLVSVIATTYSADTLSPHPERQHASTSSAAETTVDDDEAPISPLDILSSFCSAILDSQIDPQAASLSSMHPGNSYSNPAYDHHDHLSAPSSPSSPLFYAG
ncbi:hypothetical protein SeMB42_g04733 [Synchytrium endobioticum]|uniref:Zn(2)-C6 fungal-type domain-containing protein n=1 Tax=Synchytrium endobioticum TaxID=286115 RepID=A0A507CYQ7_9FUNG|nr:hypothetical protein SeMB42_g04733 [Synchytrium endobioticum]TPX44312.1 hypothetical protein SeLEV6574_g04581 [Synchytrium endobioticum]